MNPHRFQVSLEVHGQPNQDEAEGFLHEALHCDGVIVNKVKPALHDIPYPVMMRLRLIEVLLTHYGSFQRKCLMDYFGISMPQVSMDIRLYISLAPNNLVYDKSARCWKVGVNSKRIFN